MKQSVLWFFILVCLGYGCQSPKLSNLCDPNSEQYRIFSFLITNNIFPSPNERCLPNPKIAVASSNLETATTPQSTPEVPELKVTPNLASGSNISKTTSLVFRFDQVVSSDKCTVGSSFSQESFSKSYAIVDGSNSTLTLKPSSSWNVGVMKEISLDCTADNGSKTKSLYTANYHIADFVRFVSISGSDSNSGLTAALAKQSISSALTSLSSDCTSLSNSCYVLVSEGTYSISSSITLQNYISIYGSFTNDFASRKHVPSSSDYNPSVLEDSRNSTGGSLVSPIAAITVTGAVEKASTLLDGFTIKSSTGGTGTSAAIFYNSITGTGVTISNNKLIIQNPGTSYGVLCLSNSSGDFTSNEITQSGTFTGTTVRGVYFGAGNSLDQPFSSFSSNTISMGVCSGPACTNLGLFMEDSNQNLSNNIITGGNSTGAGSFVSAIRLLLNSTNNSITLSGNTITGGNCSGSTCVVHGIRAGVTGYATVLTISQNTINGGTCTGSNCETRAIEVIGGNVTNDVAIKSNTISAGTSLASGSPYSYGILVDSGASNFVDIESNTITNGSTNTSFGIAIGLKIGSTGSLTGLGIHKNTIKGGSGNLVLALWGTPSSNISINRNRFEGGSTTSSGNATVDLIPGNNFVNNIIVGGSESSGPSVALRINGGSQSVAGNTIIGKGSGSEAVGVEFNAANTVNFEANLVVTDSGATNRYCVKESGASFGPSVFNRNALYDCPTAYYVDQDSAGPNKQFWCNAPGNFSTFAVCTQSMLSPAGSSNIDPVDPLFFDRTNGKYCLTSSSPSTIKTGATYFGTNVDFNGNNRPGASYSIGAYEAGSTCN